MSFIGSNDIFSTMKSALRPEGDSIDKSRAPALQEASLAVPTSVAAIVWQDEPKLFARLRNRLTSYAPNTQRALASDWRTWRRWCEDRAVRAFPAAPQALVDYLLAHSPPLEADAAGAISVTSTAEGLAVRRASTVQRWLGSLSILHRIADVPDPTRSEDVKACRRTITRGRAIPEQKAALRWAHVERALESLGSSPRDLRAKALITVGYSTLARRAELVDLRIEDLSSSDDGDGTATLRTKGGNVEERYLAPEACKALQAWIKRTGIKEGPVFRRLERNGQVGERTINTAEVARTFKRIATMIGLDPSSVASISAHSTRIGAAQDLTAAGAALPEIMVAGGWKSPQMPTHYARKLTPRQGAMRRWIETVRKRELHAAKSA
jgi:integrase